MLEWNFPLLAGAAAIAAGVLLGALWSAVMLDKTSYLTLLRDLYGGGSGTRIEPEFASILSALFLRNVIASLAAIAVGLLHRWLSAALGLLNGIVIGIVCHGAVAYAGVSMGDLLVKIVPHGIFEIPAFILAVAVGIRTGTAPGFSLRIQALREAMLAFVAIVVLLGIAAAIEAKTILSSLEDARPRYQRTYPR